MNIPETNHRAESSSSASSSSSSRNGRLMVESGPWMRCPTRLGADHPTRILFRAASSDRPLSSHYLANSASGMFHRPTLAPFSYTAPTTFWSSTHTAAPHCTIKTSSPDIAHDCIARETGKSSLGGGFWLGEGFPDTTLHRLDRDGIGVERFASILCNRPTEMKHSLFPSTLCTDRGGQREKLMFYCRTYRVVAVFLP